MFTEYLCIYQGYQGFFSQYRNLDTNSDTVQRGLGSFAKLPKGWQWGDKPVACLRTSRGAGCPYEK